MYTNPVNNHVIKLLYLNSCGFKFKLKYPEFENLIRSNDFVCFVETKTDSIDLPGYVFKSKHRTNVASMRSGGIYILLGFRENLLNHVQIFVLWVKIDGKVFNLEQPVIFGTIYIPPEYTRYSSDEAFNQIEHELHSFSTNSKYIGLIGDFNSRWWLCKC